MHEKPHRLPAKLISCSLAFGLFAFCAGNRPVFSEPTSGDPSVHVFPGAVPINANSGSPVTNSEETKPPATEAAPSQSTQAEPPVNGEATAQPDAATTTGETTSTSSSDSTSTASQSESDINSDKTFEELEAQQQHNNDVAAANAYQHWAVAGKYFGNWDLDLAEVEYDEAIRYQPEMKIAHRDVCLVSLMQGNFARSLAEFMMVVGLGDPIPLDPKESHALDIKAMHSHYKRGLAFGKDSKWDNAIAELKWAMLYSPHDYSIHHSLAFAYASKGDLEEADKEYSETFAEQPNDGMAHADYANMLADRGENARAEAEMRKAVAIDPNAAALHIDLGWLAEGRKDNATAVAEFGKAVELSPNHANLWSHLARLKEANKDVDGAATAYAKALQLDPASTDAKIGLERVHQKQQDNVDNNNDELPTNMHNVS